MLRERVSESTFVFISEDYAEVTAGVIITSEGTILIDSLPFPWETAQIISFLQKKNYPPVRYVINTHFHADHVYGNYLFPKAELIAHRLCRQNLLKYGEASLEEAKSQMPELAQIQLRIPSLTFDESMTLRLGGKTVQLFHTPGHTNGSIVVYLKEEKVLFAGDTMMPVPYIPWGNRESFVESLRMLKGLALENIVQGHGDVLLRGEVKEAIEASIAYLETIHQKVKELVDSGAPKEALKEIDIESCGRPRVPLGGLVQELHEANLQVLYNRLSSQRRAQAKEKSGSTEGKGR